jgi:CHAD domain-containing protein
MYYILNRQSQLQPILQKLADDYQISKRPLLKKNVTYFDTFDWRLYENGLICHQQEDIYCLSSLKNQKVISSIKISDVRSTTFWWDFPSTGLQKSLAAILDVRALLPLLTCHFQIRPYDILNRDLKIVTRILLKTPTIMGKNQLWKLKPILKLETIRGYRQDYRKINQLINESGIAAEEQPYPLQLFAGAQLNPGSYSSKINIQLDPATPVREALRQIFIQLLSIITLNLPGIIEDWDSEFLHDFRVAIRRTRSILGQAKYVFPAGRSRQFRQQLGKLQKSTNHLRDLDVYLLRKEQYRAILPKKLQPGVNILFQEIAEERSQEQQKIKSFLSSPQNIKILAAWESYLQEKRIPSSRNAQIAVLPFSQKIIRQRLEKVINKGNNLLPKKPAKKKLHELRIECKKLRYLLESFSSLYPEKKIPLLIDHLKLLQNLLGDINDLSIQIRDLDQRFEIYRQSAEAGTMALAAMGGLLTHFHQKQQELIRNFQKTFREFNSPDIIAANRQLFS